jgi:signal recognition particle subunit SRP19
VVGRDEGKLVLWPHYFDRNLTRAQGRRVPANLAVEDPKAGHIANEARPPAYWHKSKGRVLVPKKGKKEEVLKQIASRL